MKCLLSSEKTLYFVKKSPFSPLKLQIQNNSFETTPIPEKKKKNILSEKTTRKEKNESLYLGIF